MESFFHTPSDKSRSKSKATGSKKEKSKIKSKDTPKDPQRDTPQETTPVPEVVDHADEQVNPSPRKTPLSSPKKPKKGKRKRHSTVKGSGEDGTMEIDGVGTPPLPKSRRVSEEPEPVRVSTNHPPRGHPDQTDLETIAEEPTATNEANDVDDSMSDGESELAMTAEQSQLLTEQANQLAVNLTPLQGEFTMSIPGASSGGASGLDASRWASSRDEVDLDDDDDDADSDVEMDKNDDPGRPPPTILTKEVAEELAVRLKDKAAAPTSASTSAPTVAARSGGRKAKRDKQATNRKSGPKIAALEICTEPTSTGAEANTEATPGTKKVKSKNQESRSTKQARKSMPVRSTHFSYFDQQLSDGFYLVTTRKPEQADNRAITEGLFVKAYVEKKAQSTTEIPPLAGVSRIGGAVAAKFHSQREMDLAKDMEFSTAAAGDFYLAPNRKRPSRMYAVNDTSLVTAGGIARAVWDAFGGQPFRLYQRCYYSIPMSSWVVELEKTPSQTVNKLTFEETATGGKEPWGSVLIPCEEKCPVCLSPHYTMEQCSSYTLAKQVTAKPVK